MEVKDVVQRHPPVVESTDTLAMAKEMMRAVVAKQIMTPEPKTVYATDPVLAAVRSMRVYGIRHLLVTDQDGHLEGIVSDRDVRMQPELWAISDPRASLVASVMTRDVLSVGPDEPVETVVAALADWRIGALPVVDADRRVLGIISYVDVLGALADRINDG